MIHRKALLILASAAPVLAQYAGPAILSRGEVPAALRTAQITFRPYLDVTAVYDTGLAGFFVGSQSTLVNAAAAGVELTGGLSGVHSWKHTQIGLDYQGSFRQYNRKTYYGGPNQSLMLGISHQLSRHVTLALRETAGLFSQNYGLLALPQTVPFDPSTSYIPATDYFDNRTLYTATQADLIFQRSRRLSYDFGADGFLVRRRSSALYGVTSATARGDVQYRITRHTTVGANYSYSHYGFTGVFSSTDLHAISGTYAVRLTRRLEFTGFAGVMRMETKFVQNVPVDPIIVDLLGIRLGTQVIYHVQYLPNFQGRLSRTFHNGVAYVSGGHTVTPGNGLFLTSTTTSAMAGYDFNGLRLWSLGVNANYTYSKTVVNATGDYGTMSGGFTAARQIRRAFHGLMSFNLRKYGSGTFSLYNRLVYEARIGFGIAPGDLPMRIW